MKLCCLPGEEDELFGCEARLALKVLLLLLERCL